MRRDSLPIHAVEEPRRVRIRGIVDGLLTLSADDVRLMGRPGSVQTSASMTSQNRGTVTPAGTLPSAERIGATINYH